MLQASSVSAPSAIVLRRSDPHRSDPHRSPPRRSDLHRSEPSLRPPLRSDPHRAQTPSSPSDPHRSPPRSSCHSGPPESLGPPSPSGPHCLDTHCSDPIARTPFVARPPPVARTHRSDLSLGPMSLGPGCACAFVCCSRPRSLCVWCNVCVAVWQKISLCSSTLSLVISISI